MLTSPTASNSVNTWPTLGRPKVNPFNAQIDSSPFKSFKNDQNENGMNFKPNLDHSDDESVDCAIDDLEITYARPEFNESFGTAIAIALNKAAHSKNPRKQQVELPTTTSTGGKKKKNSKKTILFSTGNRTFDGN